MTNKFIDYIKTYWPVVTAVMVIMGTVSSGITYYARVEAESLIKKQMEKPIEQLNRNAEEVNRSINELKLQSQQNQLRLENSQDKIKGVDDKLNLIIQMMKERQ